MRSCGSAGRCATASRLSRSTLRTAPTTARRRAALGMSASPTPRRAFDLSTQSCPERAVRRCGGAGSASIRCRRSGRRPSPIRNHGRHQASRWRSSSRQRGRPRQLGGCTSGCRLSAVTGARRGEVVALQWADIDFGVGVVRLDENYVRTADGVVLKDTKTHQMRRVSDRRAAPAAGSR